jgi:glycosyltransferase involved in cell wall biosynthesis
MNNPLVSIIIPTYNRAHLIGETLDSVVAQTYENWECIVVDDGSTDSTEEVVAEYANRDSRFQYHRRPSDRGKGANSCRNYGFKKCKGEYVNWLDSDDIIDSNKIEMQITQLLKHDLATIAICRWGFFTSNLEDADMETEFKVYKNFDTIVDFIDALALSGGFLPSHAYLISRDLVFQAGNWMESLVINQDAEFFARIFVKAGKVVFINNSNVYYRKNIEDNVSNLATDLKMNHAILSWQLIENYFIIRFGESTRLVNISKKYLYQRIFKVNIKIINENRVFFKEEIITNKVTFKQMLKRKLKRK